MPFTYNVARVSNGAGTENIFAPTPLVVRPNCDAPPSTHLINPIYQETFCIKSALDKWRKETGLPLTSLIVGNTVGLIAIASDSEVRSVAYNAVTINGFVFSIVMESGASLSGAKYANVACVTANTAGASLTLVGNAVERAFVIPTANPVRAVVDYVGMTITALPAAWATNPVVPNICVTATYVNHQTSFSLANV